MLGPEQTGCPVDRRRVALSRAPERREEHEIRGRGSDEHALAARCEPPGGECDEDVGEHRDRSVYCRERKPGRERRADLARGRTREPYEPQRGHEDTEWIVLLARPDQEATGQERPADRQR